MLQFFRFMKMREKGNINQHSGVCQSSDSKETTDQGGGPEEGILASGQLQNGMGKCTLRERESVCYTMNIKA